jgi:hypothetical protein
MSYHGPWTKPCAGPCRSDSDAASERSSDDEASSAGGSDEGSSSGEEEDVAPPKKFARTAAGKKAAETVCFPPSNQCALGGIRVPVMCCVLPHDITTG